MAGPSKPSNVDEAALYSISPPSYDSFLGDHHRPTSIDSSTFSRRSSFVLAHEGLGQVLPTREDGRLTLNLGKDAAQLYNRFITSAESSEISSDSHSDIHDGVSESESMPPRLNIVLQVVGSRGDVQPFLALAKGLQRSGHRVRLATHPVFRDLAKSHDIEFFSIGGDPAELMAYMVRNPGLLPKFDALRRGEVYRRRRAMREMLRACWRSCYEPASGISTGEEQPSMTYTKSKKVHERSPDPRPFVADAIIANPPAFAHIHCAEKLGIPLHIVFTMPWSPTREFAHPLADIQSSGDDITLARYLSYFLVDAIIWQGLGSVVNRFRYKVLDLEPLDPTLAPGMLHRLRIPHLYCWSPTLIPKPHDWGSTITVPGYFLLSRPTNYSVPKALRDFLSSGDPPIYVGFGSIVIDDPASLTSIIFKAIELAGVRAVIASGWRSLNTSQGLPDSCQSSIFVLEGDCPHDYLFQHVSLVVHHGGAGTTAASLAAGRPSIVVPFFGDQFFWGNMVYRAGVGPAPIPYLSLNALNLASAIKTTLEAPLQLRARELSGQIRSENGVEASLQSFHSDLHRLQVPRCSLFPDRVAVWRYTLKTKSGSQDKSRTESSINLSPLAATFLRKHNFLSSSSFEDLSLLHFTEHNVASGPFEPVSGAAWAILDLLYDSFKGMGEILTEVGHIPYLGVKAFDKGKASYRSSALSQHDQGHVQQLNPNSSSVGHHSLPGSFMLKGTLRLTKAAARAPGAFTSALASGAHNLPLLYNDPTVRPTPKVSGVGSGLKAGVSELTLGLYDGIAGLFTQPIMGAIDPSRGLKKQEETGRSRESGPNNSNNKVEYKEGDKPPWSVGASAVGFTKGLSRGVVGLPVKFFAAASGIVGYPLKGVDAAVTKAWHGGNVVKEIRGQRVLQGEREYYAEGFMVEQIREVERRWLDIVSVASGEAGI